MYSGYTEPGMCSPNWSHLLSLDVTLDLGDFDLQGVQFLIRHHRDVGHRLQFIHRLEAEIRERNVPFTVILLGFPGVEGDKSINRPATSPLLLENQRAIRLQLGPSPAANSTHLSRNSLG